jgi:hypothetical protein
MLVKIDMWKNDFHYVDMNNVNINNSDAYAI